MTTPKRVSISAGILLILAVGCLLAFYLRRTQIQPVSATSFKLNTIVKITLYDSDDRELLNEAMSLCDKYEAIFSRTLPSSELYQLNQGSLPAQNQFYKISDSLTELISLGLHYSQLSDGAFDLSIGSVSSLWDFTSGEKNIPSSEEISAALKSVNYRDIILKENSVHFNSSHIQLDLGAIAKGYIADKIKEFLLSRGVRSAIIDLGGNVLCIGSHPDGSPFKVGIRLPFADYSQTASTVDISDKSVVSSGIYERYFEKDGKLYHHLLNPKDGYPCDNELSSVTIISHSSADGDGLSTSCFALGLEKGMELINSLPDVQAVFITRDGILHYSENFKEEVSLISS